MKSIHKLLLLVSGMIIINGYTYGQEKDNGQQVNEIMTDNSSVCTSGCCCGINQTPIGVMNDHIHAKGKWMISYSYMDMMMKGNHIGSSPASDNEVYQNYMMAPETMNMQMHMGMLMYGVTNRLTLMAMAGFVMYDMSMNMSANMPSMPGMIMTPGNTTMQSSSYGLTDTKVSALYNFSNQASQRIIGSLGISVPTGTVMATGTTLLGDNQRLPYDMQPGTGSYSLFPDITYVRNTGLFSYGANAGANINLNNNSLGYRIGNTYHATAWATYQLLSFVSGSLRLEGIDQGMIMGSDPAMENANYQQNDPTTKNSNYGGKWLNVYAGLNFFTMNPALKKFVLKLEYGLPAYQDLNGTQMSSHSNLLAGLQYSF